jgi:hypothetical protein
MSLAGAEFEVEVARRLAATGSPLAALEPRVEPRVYERDGFAVTFWTFYEAQPPAQHSPAEYADALRRLHAGMRGVEIATPHFSDRAAEAERLVTDRGATPSLAEADRYLNALYDTSSLFVTRVIVDLAIEQLRASSAPS